MFRSTPRSRSEAFPNRFASRGKRRQLQTETSSEGATLEGAYLQGLPLYQRNVKATFYLTPNVDIAGFGYSGNLQGFHISGLQDSKVGYFQDGTFAVANNNGTIYTTDPIQSTVEEVKILSTTLPAEYGHSGGGAMTAVQRTGTNTLHGEVSEFGRVSAMQHRKYFDLYHFGQIQPGQVATPSELFQQPNATLYGPVYIPKLYNGKNRTFFVFAVERLIEKQAKQQAYTVPDANELAGNFSFRGNRHHSQPALRPAEHHPTCKWNLDAQSDSRQYHSGQPYRSRGCQVYRVDAMGAAERPRHLQQHRSAE